MPAGTPRRAAQRRRLVALTGYAEHSHRGLLNAIGRSVVRGRLKRGLSALHIERMRSTNRSITDATT